MQITFADIIIAQEPSQGGFDAVTGFLPEGDQDVQPRKRLRAKWAIPKSRDNRLHVLVGQITPPPFATPGAALISLMLRFGSLPGDGTLIFTEADGESVIFQNASLKHFRPLKREGVFYAMELTFWAGMPAQNNQVIVNESGAELTDGNGNQIIT